MAGVEVRDPATSAIAAVDELRACVLDLVRQRDEWQRAWRDARRDATRAALECVDDFERLSHMLVWPCPVWSNPWDDLGSWSGR